MGTVCLATSSVLFPWSTEQSTECRAGAQWTAMLPGATLGPTFSHAHLVPKKAHHFLDLGSVQKWLLNGSDGT